ncbi:hypothetical protein F4810DRAFT_641860 [Camillea tinctor]|nr:hypothetical protein F4810DRAFT_641860 [Camillea tinctor]
MLAAATSRSPMSLYALYMLLESVYLSTYKPPTPHLLLDISRPPSSNKLGRQHGIPLTLSRNSIQGINAASW